MNSVLVVGAGSIGRRHIQCLKEAGIGDIFVCEPDQKCLQTARSMFDLCGCFSDLGAALDQTYDGAIICVPNHLHADIAVRVIEKDIPILLEKPIEIGLEAASRIVRAASSRNVVCQVGYCLRFSSALELIHRILRSGEFGKVLCADISVGQYLPDWRPGADYRKVYSAIREQGGGVCLDISHELDYFRWLFGEPRKIWSDCRKISDLQIDTEDIAEAVVETDSGVLGRIHLDYLSRAVRRQLYITLEKGNINFDFISNSLQIFKAGDDFWKQRVVNEDRNAMFKKQFRHFTDCVEKGQKPLVDAQDAVKTLEFVLNIRKSFDKSL